MFSEQAIGIDLGTENTIVFVKGNGIVLREPSVIAMRHGNVIAVGEEASAMRGRTPGNIEAFRPVEHGVITDFSAASQMLSKFLRRILRPLSVSRKPRVIVSVPACATLVERRAVEDAAKEAGAKTAVTIEAGLAAAIGAGLPVANPSGSMIVDIGAGTTEVAVIALGGVVAKTSLRLGGADIDAAIVRYLKHHCDLMIGEKAAESIKKRIGCAKLPIEDTTISVTGRSLLDGLPKHYEISASGITQAIRPVLEQMLGAVYRTLEKAPAELSADLVHTGIVLTGGMAQLTSLNSLIAASTGLPVVIADNPMDCTAIGAGMALDYAFSKQSRIQLQPVFI